MDRLKDLKSGGDEKGADEDVEMEDVDLDENAKNDPDLEEFFQDVDKVKARTKEIRANVDQIQTLYSKLLAEADSERGSSQRKQLTNLRTETNNLASQTRTDLKKMRTSNDEYLRAHKNDPSKTQLRTNIHGSLVRNFFDLIQEYQAVLNKHDAKMREKAYRQVKVVAPEATEEEVNEILDQGGDVEQLFEKAVINDRKQQGYQQTLDYLKERHNDLLDLEAAISELQSLFQDMAILVETQGDLVDQVQYTVSTTKAYHDDAGRRIGETAKIKTGIRKKKVIICIIITFTIVYVIVVLLIIFAVLFGVLYAQFRN
eukprot:TRINITY_DN10692_c0_g1_i1.p1 TRINITY_DN10692_c0_g1~~TRINITY_DN10692_c0_g1_i1.p1  ORF type:complete len:315 (-),score=61.62 TRINITY_DN10692_c0_g1_i1:82-1026(-)